MSRFVVEGTRRLEGEIYVQGSKNSVLPILASVIICGSECVLHNCPQLTDVEATIKILKYLGCTVKREGSTLIIDPKHVFRNDIPDFLMRELRSSIIFLGSMISRIGCARLSLPGGCEIGTRPIDLHLDSLRQMGLIISEEHGYMDCTAGGRLEGCEIALSFPSVGATENLILASVKSKGTTTITNAAKEPEISDLINFLNKCGAKISGAGGSNLTIEGVRHLYGTEHTIMPDRIVASTYMAAAAITGGKVTLNGVVMDHLASIIPVFEESGCMIGRQGDSTLILESPAKLYSNKLIRTMPYPGFPTDCQSIIMAMATTADGTSVFVENIFESRYKHVGELLRLGADIKVEGKVAIVEGVKRLSGANVKATDLRGGASLIIAALNADGTTNITNIGHIERGYENIEHNLSKLGASIKKI